MNHRKCNAQSLAFGHFFDAAWVKIGINKFSRIMAALIPAKHIVYDADEQMVPFVEKQPVYTVAPGFFRGLLGKRFRLCHRRHHQELWNVRVAKLPGKQEKQTMFKQWIFCDIISLTDRGQLLLAIRSKGFSEAFKNCDREHVTDIFLDFQYNWIDLGVVKRVKVNPGSIFIFLFHKGKRSPCPSYLMH